MLLKEAGQWKMAANRKKEALELFNLNAPLFPGSYNTHHIQAEVLAFEPTGNKKPADEHC